MFVTNVFADSVMKVEELAPYSQLYEDVMTGKVDADNHRHDLGSHVGPGQGRRENICQVTLSGNTHLKTEEVSHGQSQNILEIITNFKFTT